MHQIMNKGMCVWPKQINIQIISDSGEFKLNVD